MAALGFQPLMLWPLTLLGLAGLVALVVRADRVKTALRLGWLWGVGHFTVGNGWIATAFTFQANMPAWLGWIAVFLLALYLAVFPAAAALGAWLVARRRPPVFIAAFAASWILAEWLRSWLFTGFAWNPLGVALLGPYGHPGLAALAAVLGTYGLSGLCAALGAALSAALSRAAEPGPQRAAWGALALGLLALPGLAMLLPTPRAAAGHMPFTLVQPDIRQDVLNNPAEYEKQFVKTARLTLPQRAGERRVVFWPESGVPDYLRAGYPLYFYQQTTFAADPVLARRRIARVVGAGSVLLTGATDLEMRGGAVAGARNTVTALDDTGEIRASYAKAHLVPYGEYLPMRALLTPLGLSRFVPGDIDFWPGPGPRTLDLGPWGKAGVQVCYEIVFSGEVVDHAHRPDYLFNPSNDGWFGRWGPPQHLAQARLRAIEEGLPVLRATTTGISAVIDSHGVVRQFVPRHVAARIDGLIPPPAAPTPFARGGNAIPLGLATVLLVLSLVAMRLRRS
ncbi:MAG: apolipoprotein N-acyltransferase [Sphingomonadales bacterium]|nr:apolipoprotein N-acyltransferase [Sphingomonadales bacterium]